MSENGPHDLTSSDDVPPRRIAAFREMQRSIPGVEGLYHAARAILAASIPKDGTVLVLGAAGARELELFLDIGPELRLIAVDISPEKLHQTKDFMDVGGHDARIDYITGTIDVAPAKPLCDGATSLLVMHSLPDDGTKLRFLQSIRSRLAARAPFVLADISLDHPAEFERTVPAFLEHARRAGVAADHYEVDPRLVPTMPIISDRRTRDLLDQAAFGEVTPFYRGFWYAGWWARAI